MIWKRILALGLVCTLFMTEQSIVYAAENTGIELQLEESGAEENMEDFPEEELEETVEEALAEDVEPIQEETSTEDAEPEGEELATGDTEPEGEGSVTEDAESVEKDLMTEDAELVREETVPETADEVQASSGVEELRFEETWAPESIEEFLDREELFSRQEKLLEEEPEGEDGAELPLSYFRLLEDGLETEIYECLAEFYTSAEDGSSEAIVFSLGKLTTESDTLEEDEAVAVFRNDYQEAFRNALWAFAYDHADADWLDSESCSLNTVYTGTEQSDGFLWSVEGTLNVVCQYTEGGSAVSELTSNLDAYHFAEQTSLENVKTIYEELFSYLSDAEETDSEQCARVFKAFCDYAEIECVMVSGKTEDSFHVWNYVCPDGENWYTVDLYHDVNSTDVQSDEHKTEYMFPLLTEADFMIAKAAGYEDGEEYNGYKGAFISLEEYNSGMLDENNEPFRYWVHAGTVQEVLEKLDALTGETIESEDTSLQIENTGYVYVTTCVANEFEGELKEEGIMAPDSFSGILFAQEEDGDIYRCPDFPVLHLCMDTDMIFSENILPSGTTFGFYENSDASVTIVGNGGYTMPDGDGGEGALVLDAASGTGTYALQQDDNDGEKTALVHVSRIQEGTVSVTGNAAGSTAASAAWKDVLEIPEELRIPVIDGEAWNIALNVDSLGASAAGSGAVSAINKKAGCLIGTAYYTITMSMTSGDRTCYFSEMPGSSAEISVVVPSSFATSYGTVKAVRYCDEKAGILTGKNSSGKMTFTADRFSTPDSQVVYSLVLVSNLKYSITSESSLTVAVTGTSSSSAALSVPSTVQYGGKTYKVTAIGGSAFKNNTKLATITIGSNVTSIGTYAFYGNTKLTTVKMGSAVKTVGSNAFYGCMKLSSLTIGSAVTSIGSYAFGKCTALTKVTIPNKVTSIGDSAFSGDAKLATLTIGSAVTSIGSKAFYKCTSLAKVTIPNKVTSIGTYAFCGNTKLTTVKIGSAVKTIGDYAFYGCTKLSSLTLGAAVTSIGSRAFYKCTSLTKVTIPNKVTSIGTYAFYGNTKLTTVKIGSAVKTIGGYAFYGCTKLSSLTLGAAVTSIGSRAFYDCAALTKVGIPNKVTSIGSYAFYGCKRLSALTIGTEVKTIGTAAFYGCKSLKAIVIKSTKLTSSGVGSNAFKGIYSKVKIKVPLGKLSSYKKILLARGVPSTATIYAVTFSNSDKVKVKSCSASAYNSGKGKMTVKIKISMNSKIKELNTMNTSFYILRMDNMGTSVLAKIPATITSTSDSAMMLSGNISSTDNFSAAMMSTYAVAVKDGSNYRQITSNSLFIENPEITATMTEAYNGYYESDGKVTSKKGLQGASEDYMEDLGVQHVLLNVDLADMVSTKAKSGYVKYSYKGKTYYFQDMVALVQTMRYLNGWDNNNPYGWHRRNVTLVLLLSWKDDLSYLIHPSARKKGAAPYYALNMKEKKAQETFEALFCYMGEKLGDNKKSRVCNWVLGNEVNCCEAWNYSGGLSLSDCVKNYAAAFQLLYQGVKRTASTSRVFISLDHSWTASNSGHSGKSFLDAFASYMNNTAPKMQWNVDYHPYSQPLTKVDFWNDGKNTTSSSGTPYISMKNINVLTNYLGTLEKKYGKTKGSIRVILGEQGFTAVQGNSGSEKKQAAALGYGYYIAAFNTRVDAYIIRSYLDDRDETRTGLYLGLMSTSHKKKASYDIYKYVDTNKSTAYMKKYLSTVGLSSWKKGISNFNENALNTGDF